MADEILRVITKTGVRHTVCADYFMERHHPDAEIASRSQAIMRRLFTTGKSLADRYRHPAWINRRCAIRPHKTAVQRMRPFVEEAEQSASTSLLRLTWLPTLCGPAGTLDSPRQRELRYRAARRWNDPAEELASYGQRMPIFMSRTAFGAVVGRAGFAYPVRSILCFALVFRPFILQTSR